MQLTAFGPGVVTKTTQNSANMVQASKLIVTPIDRRGDHPDRHSRSIIGVDPAERLATNAEAVAGLDGEGPVANLKIKLTRNKKTDLLGLAGDNLSDLAVRLKGRMHHLEIVCQIR